MFYAALEASTPVETVTNAMTDIFTLVGTVITEITTQPLLLFFFAVSFIGVGIGVFRMLKNAARG